MDSRLCICKHVSAYVVLGASAILLISAYLLGMGPEQNNPWADLRRSEELFQHNIHSSQHFSEEEVVSGLVHGALLCFVPSLLPW